LVSHKKVKTFKENLLYSITLDLISLKVAKTIQN